MLGSLPSEALQAKALKMLNRAPGTGGASQFAVTPPDSKLSLPNAAGQARRAGHSTEQQQAEAVMLEGLAQRLGVQLAPRRLTLPDGSYVEVDGVSEVPPVLVEVWAHQGKLVGAQRNKVLADALKLVHVARQLGSKHRTLLCLGHETAAAPFLGRSWYAGALRAFDVEIVVVAVDEALRTAIRAAQERQRR